jgi:F420-dependent oxidoreductase-like protein
MTQIGLMVEGQFGLTWARWKRLLRAAESLGYQCVFRSDHFTIAPPDQESLEAWVSLAYAASHTRRIEFGTLVTPVTFRHPSITLRMAAAVDDLSRGRLVHGMGMGWNKREHRQFGVEFHDIPTRHAMLKDALEITTRLFHQADPVTYKGKHFSVKRAVLLPRPHRPGGPPILIGGNGPKLTLPLAAKYADEWNGVFLSPDDFRQRNALLNELLEHDGRAVSSVKRSLMTEVVFGENDAELRAKLSARRGLSARLIKGNIIGGTPAAIIDRIGSYVEAGTERLMLQWLDLDDLDGLEKMAHTVLPHFANSVRKDG